MSSSSKNKMTNVYTYTQHASQNLKTQKRGTWASGAHRVPAATPPTSIFMTACCLLYVTTNGEMPSFEGWKREWHGHPFVLWQWRQMWLCIYFTTLHLASSLSLKSRGISTWSQVLASYSAAPPAEVVLPAASECRVSSFWRGSAGAGKPTQERELGHFVCLSFSFPLSLSLTHSHTQTHAHTHTHTHSLPPSAHIPFPLCV